MKLTANEAVAPGARLAALTVTKAAPAWLPLALARATPAGKPPNTTWNGPLMAVVPVLVKANVPVYFCVARLKVKPELAVETAAVISR